VDSEPKTIPGGRLIVFDGIDGSGKTTQLTSAKVTLESAGWQVENFRYLGGSPMGEKLREVMFSPIERSPETDLYMALAVQYALADEINKARGRGSLILLDRGPLSLLAYEFYGPDFNLEEGLTYFKAAWQQFRPELTIWLKCDIELALRRSKREINGDYFGNQPLAYFDRVNRGYETGAKEMADKLLVFNAIQSIEQTNTRAIAKIEATLNLSDPQ